MPYFVDEKNCVHKGTKEEPGEQVECHESQEAAVAHMRALYAAEEDKAVTIKVDGVVVEVVKGGRGSGWHNPPEGTHTAENAPNFRGGPGADREYGTESDEPPKGSKLCKCTKCDSTFTLPKGKQCEDVKCPGCGGGARQTSPRKDPKSEGEGGRGGRGSGKKTVDADADKAMDAPGPQVHGEGGSLGEVSSVMDDGSSSDGCKCPKCDKGLPCTAKACPYCKESIERAVRDDEEKRAMKAEGDGKHPASHYLVVEDPEKPTTWHLRVRGTDGELDHGLMGGAWAALHGGYRGNTYEGPNKEMALAKLKRFYEQEGMDTPGESKSAFASYKSADGTWRWATLSNWAVIDKEREVVSEQAYRDAISHAQKTGDWGELDLVHVDGTDVGDCDMLFIQKCADGTAKIGGGGTWYDTAKATNAREVIQAEPEHWGVSIKFRFNPERRVQGVYTGDIQVLKHSILPQQMAASYGTAIAVQGGKSMSKVLDEKTAEALRNLKVPEDEIAELAEKNKALPIEENVVEKEDTATGDKESLLAQLGKMLGIGTKEETAPDASEPEEARKTEEVAPVKEVVEAEKVEGGELAEGGEPDVSVLLQTLGATMAKSIGEQVKAQLDERDKRIAALEDQIKAMSVSVEEQVEQRLSDVPPVVKVAASAAQATVVQGTDAGFTFGRQPPDTQNFMPELMKSITQATKDTVGDGKIQV